MKYIKITAAVMLLMLGAGILLFPVISNFYADKHHTEVISEYEEVINQLEEEERNHLRKAAQAYNEKLCEYVQEENPFVQDMSELNEEYDELLNVNGDGIMGYIKIPSINVYLPIYHGTSEAVLEKGAGHLLNSSLPVGGESTHTVISAHTGLPSDKMFDDLDQLEEGNLFLVYILGKTYAYEVDKISVVLPHEVEELKIAEGEDYATLLTCTPYGINTHRLLVRGKRVVYTEEAAERVTTVRYHVVPDLKSYWMLIPFGIAGLGFGLIRRRRRSEKNQSNNNQFDTTDVYEHERHSG